MKRVVSVLAALGVLALAPLAQASDRSLERALGADKSRLTSDISYLASFSAPSRSSASGVLSRLSRIGSDLNGASRAASSQRASSSSGRHGQLLILTALSDAMFAESEAHASASAARSGSRSTASRDARAEQGEINRAIPDFESGGHLLHLF